MKNQGHWYIDISGISSGISSYACDIVLSVRSAGVTQFQVKSESRVIDGKPKVE